MLPASSPGRLRGVVGTTPACVKAILQIYVIVNNIIRKREEFFYQRGEKLRKVRKNKTKLRQGKQSIEPKYLVPVLTVSTERSIGQYRYIYKKRL